MKIFVEITDGYGKVRAVNPNQVTMVVEEEGKHFKSFIYFSDGLKITMGCSRKLAVKQLEGKTGE
jgi:hypothetical protein